MVLSRFHDMATVEVTTQWLHEVSLGDERHIDELMSSVYDELKIIATRQLARESPGHLFQPTALVHEVFLRMINQDGVDWRSRSHFLAISARMMRRILVDEARGKQRLKRGGDRTRLSLSEDLTLSPRDSADVLAVDDALAKLAELDPQQAKIVELRFFGGMTVEEVAVFLGESKRTVERQWTAIRAWLRRELADEDAE